MEPKRGHQRQAHVAMMCTVLLSVGALFLGMFPGAAAAKKPEKKLEFDMVVSAAAQSCLPNASGHVRIEAADDNQRMQVKLEGLAPKTVFTFFVLQTPTNPPGFSMAWYQGDIETNADGRGEKTFLGIFSSETHIFAVTSQPAPQRDFFDAATNPATAPVHMYHLGLWFSDPQDAANANCPSGSTPFDGDHVAGIQVLNTSNFGTDADDGPLGQFEP
jgi:hypothetical protein